MMLRIAWRSLVTRPVRTGVLAFGFGFGIAVMAVLLGVGHAMLEQAHAPALQGSGDLVVLGPFGSIPNARFLLTNVIGTPEVKARIVAASPSKRARLYLMTAEGAIALNAQGGVPSLERAIRDPEVSRVKAWIDAPSDIAWSRPDSADILRSMDRFHPMPSVGSDVPGRADSWAEWLYFNGRTPDGRVRLYLTFLVGPRESGADPKRSAGVRLQLERDGRSKNYVARGTVDDAVVRAGAPNLEIAGNRVRLDGFAYHITLSLEGEDSREPLMGELTLDAAPGRSLPPASVRGTNGWVTGYVVPALSGKLRADLQVGRDLVRFADATGYHDHNWGFWQGVSWQWGQVAHDDISIVYGRVFPPSDVADASRIPGFLTVLGPDGPLGSSTDVVIDDHDLTHIEVRARGRTVDLHLAMQVETTEKTAMTMTRAATGPPMTFLQLGGTFSVSGRIGERQVDFSARGAAETFRGE